MIRHFFLFMLLVCCTAGRAQQAETLQPDSAFLIMPASTFYLRTGNPFITWSQRPDTVSFIMFDRWGEPVARSAKPDFKIEDALLDNKPPLQISATYIYVLQVSFKGKPRRVYRGNLLYGGVYCSG